jgi:hypothetical protein
MRILPIDAKPNYLTVVVLPEETLCLSTSTSAGIVEGKHYRLHPLKKSILCSKKVIYKCSIRAIKF